MTGNEMTPRQRQLVLESFPEIEEMAGPVSLLFYGRLFELNPSLRPMFRQDIELQGRKLMSMLTAVVENLDHFEDLAPVLHAMGQRHVAYGVRPEHYETVAKALLWALGQALGAEFYPEVKTAWAAVIGAIALRMIDGARELKS